VRRFLDARAERSRRDGALAFAEGGRRGCQRRERHHTKRRRSGDRRLGKENGQGRDAQFTQRSRGVSQRSPLGIYRLCVVETWGTSGGSGTSRLDKLEATQQ